MGLINTVKSFFSPKKKSVTQLTLSELQNHFAQFLSSRGLSSREAIEKCEYVFACTKAISQKISSIPFVILNGDKEDLKAKEYLLNCNQYFIFTEMISQLQSWIELRGYGILHYQDKKFLEVYDSDLFEINTENNIIKYSYEGKSVPLEEIVIVRNFSPYARLTGLSTIQAGLGEIRMSQNVQNVISKFFEKGAFLSGLLTTEQKLEEDEVNMIRDLFESTYQGADNAGDVPVMHSGIKFQSTGLSPADFNLISYKNITKETIQTIFGVPGIIVQNYEKADYANAKKQEEIFTRYTIIPKLSYNEQFFTRFLLPMIGYYGRTFKYLWTDLPELQMDVLTKVQADDYKIKNGTLLINEAREKDGLDPVVYGDDFWGNAMLVPMGGKTKKSSPTELLNKIFDLKLSEINKNNTPIVNAKSVISDDRVDRIEIVKERNSIISKATNHRYNSQIKRLKSEMEKFYDKVLKDIMSLEEITETFALDPKFEDLLIKTVKPFYFAFANQAGEFTWDLYDIKSYWLNQTKVKDWNLNTEQLQEILNARMNLLSESVYGTLTNVVRDNAKSILAEYGHLGAGEVMSRLRSSISTEFTSQKGYWAERAARTEVLYINSASTIEAGKQADMNYKAWLPSGSSNGRETHQSMDPGEFIGIDDIFDNGLYAPGYGAPEDTINCGCSMLLSWKKEGL